MRRSGVTLVEVIVAGSILLILITASLPILNSASMQGRQTETRRLAANIANEAVLKYVSQGKLDLQPAKLEHLVVGEQPFKVEEQVVEVTGVSKDELVEVRVEVRWMERGSEMRLQRMAQFGGLH